MIQDEKTRRDITTRDGVKKSICDWITKRGGGKFSLVLNYIEMKFTDGHTTRDEWYVIKSISKP